MKDKINEQLALLESELNRLKNATDYINSTKSSADDVINQINDVQANYSSYTDKIFNLYKSTVEQLEKETTLQIKEGVISFETTGTKIDQTNREKLVETTKLLENYRKTVEATDGLVNVLEAVDFPSRLNSIKNDISEGMIETTRQNKIIKNLLFTILGFVFLGSVGAVLFIMKII